MITYSNYYTEVQSLTKNLVLEALNHYDYDSEQALEWINDSLLHERLDRHEWIIYNAYHLPILQYSDNANYMLDNLGDDCVAHELKERGLSGLHCALAYWAMYADVMDILNDTMDDVSEQLDDNE